MLQGDATGQAPQEPALEGSLVAGRGSAPAGEAEEESEWPHGPAGKLKLVAPSGVSRAMEQGLGGTNTPHGLI